MDIALLIIGFICVVIGILGAVIPGLPGPPVVWLGLLLWSMSSFVDSPTLFVVVMALLAAVITVIDYVVPSSFTKRFGGSRAGVWGCNIGLVISIIGLPFGPQGLLGVVVWPFVGALVGELVAGKQLQPAVKAAFGAFIGFLTGTFAKLLYGVALLIYMIVQTVYAV